ncbi:Coagulation factor IX [Toxocara canis]|uniref:Coagulation factor IX n=1 Tax=Toxocara canis TaxID=6265 RepID=A0A0B2VSA8_TOXCA|nr:Coagulation factor IX [Toxocara canis]
MFAVLSGQSLIQMLRTIQQQVFLLLLIGVSMLIPYYRLSRVEHQHTELVHRLTADELRELHTICGRISSHNLPKYRIAGGKRASENQFPWAVRQLRKPTHLPWAMSSSCTGSLISRWHILTAAHCIQLTDILIQMLRTIQQQVFLLLLIGVSMLIPYYRLSRVEHQHTELVHRLTADELRELHTICGRISSHNLPKYRIAGGKRASENQFPWAVRQLRKPTHLPWAMSSSCTGSLISRWHILTAAHCIQRTDIGVRDVDVSTHYTVVAGSTCAYYKPALEKECDSARKRGTMLRIKSVLIAEDAIRYQAIRQMAQKKLRWSISIQPADFALLELDKPIDINNSNIRPICLLPPNQPPGDLYTLYGFGKTGSTVRFVRCSATNDSRAAKRD